VTEAPVTHGEADLSDDAVAAARAAHDEAAASAEHDLEAAKERLLKPAKGARYQATGKRKTSVARVILTPGDGSFWINGRDLGTYFPRNTLRVQVMEPFELTGAGSTYNVRARIHGGGVSSQAHALQHGIAKALSEVDPAIRSQLKGKGMLKVDTRQVERKKAGLKKARKRPQFSKR
jgi:small subunit ribosomal protein S9